MESDVKAVIGLLFDQLVLSNQLASLQHEVALLTLRTQIGQNCLDELNETRDHLRVFQELFNKNEENIRGLLE